VPNYLLVRGLGRRVGVDNKTKIMILYLENIRFKKGNNYSHKDWQRARTLTDEQRQFLREFLDRSEKNAEILPEPTTIPITKVDHSTTEAVTEKSTAPIRPEQQRKRQSPSLWRQALRLSSTKRRFSIWTGRAEAMMIIVNGRRLGSPGRGVIKKITITKDGMTFAIVHHAICIIFTTILGLIFLPSNTLTLSDLKGKFK